MRTNNSFGRIGFIIEHMIWAFIGWLWYRKLLFRCLPSHSLAESKLIFWAIVAVSCLVGLLFEMSRNRNSVSVAFNLLLGYGIYTVLTYIQIRRTFTIVCLLIAGILSVGLALLIMSRKIRNRRHAVRIFRRRIVRVILTTQRIMGAGLVFLMIVYGVDTFWGLPVVRKGGSTAAQIAANEQTISNNMETLVLLQEEAWDSLSVQERLRVLQTVANIEQQYLGLPNELNLKTENLSEDERGCYFDGTYEITIDTESLFYESSSEMVMTVCHEAFHSYQHRMVDVFHSVDENNKNLRMFRKAASYEEEFSHYIDGEDDFPGYYNQDCESDARAYSEDAVKEYFSRINEYLQEREAEGSSYPA